MTFVLNLPITILNIWPNHQSRISHGNSRLQLVDSTEVKWMYLAPWIPIENYYGRFCYACSFSFLFVFLFDWGQMHLAPWLHTLPSLSRELADCEEHCGKPFLRWQQGSWWPKLQSIDKQCWLSVIAPGLILAGGQPHFRNLSALSLPMLYTSDHSGTSSCTNIRGDHSRIFV